ncbi:PTS-dependent dihydroxyacetone kinase phosphotransferase subunit DhaM [Nakamurella flavida]|uniref:Phosphocarrier protein HPr n=1 Tax=Nakamurella flavida TaxID=363630 RepID=A0A938YPM2_9ACTN|nr:dihydroxyacetone kinase phosphoryl donor subunit DhaM [Nakamurella flavida]MBM9477177.1 PTS-dependent dihydroxyacetone kinase phosphotransferase subunit DhaM [Nakamurella flavida]MDP9780126.1 phosphocarrier protein FPr [Nakamurella flavida]
MSIGLILVSHSAELAAGLATLAGQMAPNVRIVAAGGTDDGGIGTSFDRINQAVEQADDGTGAVLLYDLGSAVMTAETALEFLDPEQADRIRVVDTPLVEGAVAAAVTAESGGDLEAVAAAARSARSIFPADDPTPGKSGVAIAPQDDDPAGPTPDVDGGNDGSAGDGAGPTQGRAGTAATDTAAGPPAGAATRAARIDVTGAAAPAHLTARLVNPLGLHARPAAALVRAVATRDARVSVGRPGTPGVDVRSVLAVVALALRGGEDVDIDARGPDAWAAAEAVAATIAGGFGESHHGAPTTAAPLRSGAFLRTPGAPMPLVADGALRAVPGSPGLVLGPLRHLDRIPDDLTHVLPARDPGGVDITTEGRRLDAAIATAARELSVGNEFDAAHAVLLNDLDLRRAAQAEMAAGAEAAWWTAVVRRAGQMAAVPDEFVAARAVDVRESGAAVLARLGVVLDRIPTDLDGAVVVAEDIGPSEVPLLVERGASAVALSRGSITAHAVIVARGLGLPLVLRAGIALAEVADGTVVSVDGETGWVHVDPPAEQIRNLTTDIDRRAAEHRQRMVRAHEPVVLADGRTVSVSANVGSLADARAAVDAGADGVGLLRTELLILDQDVFPDEDRQTADLAEILRVLGQRPTVIRVLDAGGDKPVRALDVDAVRNGFLGIRGLRYLLAHPDLLRTQLRAICRASVGHRVSVMAPMVTVAREAVAFGEAVREAVASLRRDGVEHRVPDAIGVMVEVPAAALAADELCAVVDFLSIGSNDLTSYVAAADRTEPGVADLLEPGSTAMTRILDQLCEHARRAGTPVAVCGEMAGMAEYAAELLDRGVHELSVAPARIPMIKDLVRTQRG